VSLGDRDIVQCQDSSERDGCDDSCSAGSP